MLTKVSKHRLGAVATWSHSTDLYSGVSNSAEISAFKHNLMLTVFDNHTYGITSEKMNADATGKMKFGTYFPTDRWDDPNKPNVFPVIPDYMGTVWTQDAVDAGFNVTVGESKVARYPNHGQQLFDISNGLYGYDVINGVAGTHDVLSGLIEHERNWFEEYFGYYPSAASYRNGRVDSGYGMGKFLSVRNSAYDVNNVSYSFTRDEARSLPTTARQGDMPESRQEILTTLESSVQKAIVENGWFRDFTHWHTIDQPNELDEFFESQRSAIGDNDVISLDYGTALQHRFLSDMATPSIFESGGNLILSVSYADPYGNLPLDVFNVPLSVEVDTAGSVLEGKDIQSNVPIRKKGTNQYIVEVPFNNTEETIQVTLSEATEPNYITLNPPVITTNVLSDGVLKVETDKLTKVVLFEVDTGKEIFDNPTIISRGNSLASTHKINYIPTGKDLYVGIIDEYGQSSLSTANSYEVSPTEAGFLMIYGSGKIPFYNDVEVGSPSIMIGNDAKGLRLLDEHNAGASNVKIFINGEVKALKKIQ